MGLGSAPYGFLVRGSGGRPEPEKRETTEREIKTTLDNEKLQTQSIGSKLSIYCELQSSVGRRLFFRRPSHTCLLSRATSCVTSNDFSKWRVCSQAKTWLTSPRGSPFYPVTRVTRIPRQFMNSRWSVSLTQAIKGCAMVNTEQVIFQTKDVSNVVKFFSG